VIAGTGSLAVLVPARNAAHQLPEWLTSVERFADAVFALDDGSTDSTRTVLEQHPLVREVLTNPVRESYEGWDDLANRQRLVDAARDAGVRWLLFLDADERIDALDGAALRAFLEREAQPGFAYGFEVFRMVEDAAHYDPHSLWVFRLFSAADAAASPLGSQRLHFVPVPSAIPQHRWLYTSVRIQHEGSLTSEHRQARFDKYREADPSDAYHQNYDDLLADPEVVSPWPDRPSDLPVLLGAEGRYADQVRGDPGAGPAITAVVIAQDDLTVIDRSVRALLDQDVEDEFEIIVVCSGSDGTSEHVVVEYPTVRCIQLPHRALPGEARNAGLWAARGEYITFPGSHVWLRKGSLQARLDAHEHGWDLVTGSVLNGNETRAGWASYFLDHSNQNPSQPAGEFIGVPGHASYVTNDVRELGGFPEDMRAGEDTVVNKELYYRDRRTYFAPDACFFHASPSTTTRQLVRHHMQRGRALGRIIVDAREDDPDAWSFRDVATIPVRRLQTIRAAMRYADRELRARCRSVRALVVTGAVASAGAAWYELLASRRRSNAPAPSVPASQPGALHGSALDAPILAIAGRPGEAAAGLLGAGTAYQSAQRLMTFTSYARTACNVRPALAPIVTSASVTAEYMGTYTIDLYDDVVAQYLEAAREVGAMTLLQIQPGRASLADAAQRWSRFLAAPDVGIYFDLRALVAGERDPSELVDATRDLREQYGSSLTVLARGVEATDPVIVPDVFDLRVPGTPYPHVAFAGTRRPAALVYN
jgi:glycosyltransferase involved in cell wall biosynthesis